MSSEQQVYKTRIVRQGPTEDTAVNYWHDLEEAKEWLEGYFRIRWGLTPGEWEEGYMDKTERWHIRPVDADDRRGVVRRVTIRDDADELLGRLEEMMDELDGELVA